MKLQVKIQAYIDVLPKRSCSVPSLSFYDALWRLKATTTSFFREDVLAITCWVLLLVRWSKAWLTFVHCPLVLMWISSFRMPSLYHHNQYCHRQHCTALIVILILFRCRNRLCHTQRLCRFQLAETRWALAVALQRTFIPATLNWRTTSMMAVV